MGACTQPGAMFIVSEYLPGGDVEKLLEGGGDASLTLYKRMKIAKDAALGINWLHCSTPVICHRGTPPCFISASIPPHTGLIFGC